MGHPLDRLSHGGLAVGRKMLDQCSGVLHRHHLPGRQNLIPDPAYRHRFPAEIMCHAVWLYHVISLSLRDVELLLAELGAVPRMQP